MAIKSGAADAAFAGGADAPLTVGIIWAWESMHGHAMGASGPIEIACSLAAVRDGFVPPTINLDTRDPECDLDYVPHQARDAKVSLFLSNSFGFGGMNAVVAVRTLLPEL